MVPPKARGPRTRTRSRKLGVFKDDTADTDDDDDNAENKPSGPSTATTASSTTATASSLSTTTRSALKRKLLPPEPGGGPPQPKRQALGDKSYAANSRDSSLRDVKRESPLGPAAASPIKKETRPSSPPPPLKKEPRVPVTAQTAPEPAISASEPSSVKAPAAAAIEISRHLDGRSSTAHQLQLLVDEERFQEAASLIAAKGAPPTPLAVVQSA